MKKFLLVTLVFLCIKNANSRDWVTPQIFACEPEWGSLAKEIVGNKAKVVVAINEFQNPHFVKFDRKLIIDIRKADIVFCTGSDLEINWLPELLKNSSKKEIQMGGSGYFMATDYVAKLEVSQDSSSKTNYPKENNLKADLHSLGNPHIHLNPNNIHPVAAELLKRMLVIDPANGIFYQKNYDNFITRWNLAIVKWEADAKNLRGMSIIVGHNNWAYLADWLTLNVIVKLEDETGSKPNFTQLSKALKQARINPGEVTIYAPFEDQATIFWFSSRAKIKATLLPYTISSTDPKVSNLFGIFDETIRRLKR